MTLSEEYNSFIKENNIELPPAIPWRPLILQQLNKTSLNLEEEKYFIGWLGSDVYSLNSVISRWAEQAEKILYQTLKIVPDFSFFCGQFPSSDVNAWVIAVPKGYLILINSGLVNYLNKVSIILPLSFQATKITDINNNTYALDEEFKFNGLSAKDVNNLILESTRDFLRYGKSEIFLPTSFDMLKANHSDANSWGSMFVETIITFIILHEFFHMILRHVPLSRKIVKPDIEVEVIVRNWEQECEADLTATLALLLHSVRSQSKNTKGEDSPELFFGTPTIEGVLYCIFTFFCLADFAESLETYNSYTHPPSLVRIKKLISALKPPFQDAPFLDPIVSSLINDRGNINAAERVLAWHQIVKATL